MSFLLKLIIFFSHTQSFVISTVIKGLTIFNVGMIVRFIGGVFYIKKSKSILIYHLGIFVLLYFLVFIIQQFFIYLFPVNIIQDAIFISGKLGESLFLRKSFFTQTAYLFLCILFFDYIINYLKNSDINSFLNFIFLSILFFIGYGYFEFFFHLITGSNPDFISNRITGDDFDYGLFQTISILGHDIMRIKALSGEPSMFAFTVLPFFTLSVYLRKRFIASILFFTLILTTSTSALLGIFIFLILDFIYFNNKFKKSVLYFIFFLFIYFVFYEIINALYQLAYQKISLVHFSGIARFSNFNNHFQIWLDSNIINKIFGYGFGYFRSTDGFTTLLVNVGLFGLLFYCAFFTLPYFLISKKSVYIKGLFITNVSLLIVILLAVPEFFYPHIWLFNALIWWEYFKKLH